MSKDLLLEQLEGPCSSLETGEGRGGEGARKEGGRGGGGGGNEE